MASGVHRSPSCCPGSLYGTPSTSGRGRWSVHDSRRDFRVTRVNIYCTVVPWGGDQPHQGPESEPKTSTGLLHPPSGRARLHQCRPPSTVTCTFRTGPRNTVRRTVVVTNFWVTGEGSREVGTKSKTRRDRERFKVISFKSGTSPRRSRAGTGSRTSITDRYELGDHLLKLQWGRHRGRS